MTPRFIAFSNPIRSKYFTTGISPAWLVNPCAVDGILTERVHLRTRDEGFDSFVDVIKIMSYRLIRAIVAFYHYFMVFACKHPLIQVLILTLTPRPAINRRNSSSFYYWQLSFPLLRVH